MKCLLRNKLILLLGVGLFFAKSVIGQHVNEVININQVNAATSLRAAIPVGSVVAGTLRSRTFDYNPRLRQLTEANKGDTLQLDFFDDTKYKAVISAVSFGINDILGITARIIDHDFASCLISISRAGICLRADIPFENEHYRLVEKNGKTVLIQLSLSEVSKGYFMQSIDYVPPVESVAQDVLIQTRAKEDIEEHATIDVLVVYSTKAKEWAERNTSGIDNAIHMAFLYANLVLANSKINLTYNMVYKYETDYSESPDANMDLASLRDDGDGILDEVHDLRRQYGADLVVLMPMTGSYAYLPDYDLNNPNPTFGFSVCNIQGSTYGSTMIHELGHNMGAHHCWKQLRTRYPGPGIFTYSSAWRDVGDDGLWYHTVMSYGGDSFADKNPSIMIPYFSNPDVIVHGVPIGSMAKENNALTLERTKHVIARYSELIGTKNPFTVNANGVLTRYNGAGGHVLIPSNLGITSIGPTAFQSNTGLLSIAIPQGIHSIGNQAFEDCTELVVASIPETINNIGALAFNNCIHLNRVNVYALIPPKVTTNTFSGVNMGGCKLIVPSGTKNAYKEAPVWKEFCQTEEREIVTEKENTELTTLKAYATAGYIHVIGLYPGETLYIYDIEGHMAYSGISNAYEQRFPLMKSGLYFVIAGDRRIKVHF